MIRAFITTWEFIPAEMRVTNPISEQAEALLPGVMLSCSMYYPDADMNGLPDGPHVLILVESDDVAIEQLDAIDGVYMFPPHPFDTPLSGIPQTTKDEVVGLCVAEGWMPTDPLFTEAVTYGDCLKLLAKHFSSGFVSFGAAEVERASEFG